MDPCNKKSRRDYVTFIVPAEFGFNPRDLAHDHGVPTLQHDYHVMLDVQRPNFKLVNDLEERLIQLHNEMDFQVNRYKTSDKLSEVRPSTSELALMMVQMVEEKCAREGCPVYEPKRKHFDQPEDIGYPPKRPKVLPSGVHPSQIIRKVVPQSPFKHLMAKNDLWRRVLDSNMNLIMVLDSFWWMFLELFLKQDDNTSHNQDVLQRNLMASFRELLLSVPHIERGHFIRSYPETLGKCVYLAFHESFPMKGPLFGQGFKNALSRVLGKWTNSAPLAPRITRQWDPFLLISDHVVPVLRNSLRAAIPAGDTRYDLSVFESDMAKLRKEEIRFGNEGIMVPSILSPSGSRFRKKSPARSHYLSAIKSKLLLS